MTSPTPPTLTVGDTLSNMLQRSLSACSSSAPSRLGSLSALAAVGSSTPPHPASTMLATACITSSAVCFLRSFIPNNPSFSPVRSH
ncbi:MAG: hypothetical protein AB7F38_03460 [Piscinibacter sp.]